MDIQYKCVRFFCNSPVNPLENGQKQGELEPVKVIQGETLTINEIKQAFRK